MRYIIQDSELHGNADRVKKAHMHTPRFLGRRPI